VKRRQDKKVRNFLMKSLILQTAFAVGEFFLRVDEGHLGNEKVKKVNETTAVEHICGVKKTRA
jgi:hypothetical protein